MQRLTPARGDDSGAVAVMVAILMVALLGFVAVVIDVGAMYSERRQLQNGADAAALAIAQDCAKGKPACGVPVNTARTYAAANANDGTAGSDYRCRNALGQLSSCQLGSEVTVTTDGTLDHWFAPILGVDESDVGAQATAAWGGLSGGPAMLPIVFAKCLFDPTKLGVEQWLIYKDNKEIATCHATGPPGGFGWLQSDGQCSALVDTSTAETFSDTGNNPNGFLAECAATLAALKNSPALLPVYIESSGNGQYGTYKLYGFAAFQLTGWRFGGGSGEPSNWNSTATPSCKGDCRGVKGFFTEFVTLDDYTTGGPTDMGTAVVGLTG